MADTKTILYAILGFVILVLVVTAVESVIHYPGYVALVVAAFGGLVFLFRYRSRLKNRV